MKSQPIVFLFCFEVVVVLMLDLYFWLVLLLILSSVSFLAQNPKRHAINICGIFGLNYTEVLRFIRPEFGFGRYYVASMKLRYWPSS